MQEREVEQGRGFAFRATLQPALIHQGVTERHYLSENREWIPFIMELETRRLNYGNVAQSLRAV